MNLNVTREARAPVERFNPRRPQGHDPTSYRPSFATLLVIIGAGLTIVAMLLFGVVTLASGGQFPDVKTLMRPYEKYVGGDKKAEAGGELGGEAGGEARDEKGQPKTDEEQMKDLLELYKTRWNQAWPFGSPPGDVFATDADVSVEGSRAKDTDIASKYQEEIEITAVHLDSYALFSDAKAQGEASFVLLQDQPLAVWDRSARAKPESGRTVVVEQAARYALTLEKGKEGWLITKMRWLGKSPARIKEAGDPGAEAFPLPEGETGFTEMRPTREAFQTRYDAIAANLSAGRFPREEAYSNYEVEHLATGAAPNGKTPGGKGRKLPEVTRRLQKLVAGASQVQFTAAVEGLSQWDENAAFVVVNYRMNLTTKSGNLYTATWKDTDTWARSTGGDWLWLKTERPRPSALRDYFSL